MPNPLDEARYEVALANRMLAHEGVLDAFGHVSARHPTDPKRYLLSRSRGPELVEPDDVLEFDLDSNPIVPPTARLYGERVIHGEIYKARPDVMAVVHHHAPAIMPFTIATEVDLGAVFHMGGTLGSYTIPVWDQRDDFGETNLLVIKPEEGASLARALGQDWTVLMRRHGATAAGRTIREVVFRCVYSCQNAQYLLQAHSLGGVSRLTPGETQGSGDYNLAPGPVGRAWEYWTVRLDKKGELPPRGGKSAKAKGAKAAKTAGKSSAKAKVNAKTKAKTAKKSKKRGR